MKQLVFFINGSHFSGAEKRLLMTAIKIAAFQQRPPRIFISASLYSHIVASQKFSAAELAAVRFDIAAVPKWLERVPRAQAIAHWRRRRSLVRDVKQCESPGDYIIHFALYNVFDLQVARQLKTLGATVVAEVTSPDIAVNANTRRLMASSQYCDALICVSENVQRLCKQAAPGGEGVSHPKLLLRHLPFVDEVYNVPAFIKKRRQVMYSHRLIDRKNPLLAIEAFTQVAQQLPEWHFQICGRGELQEQVNDAISKAECANLEFAGFVADVQNRIGMSQVFVSIIEPDNYPSQSVLEAMARGCALVLSNTGQSTTKFTDLEPDDQSPRGFRRACNGVVVDTLQADVLTQALLDMLQHGSIEHMAADSRRLFDERYSQQRYLEESIALYQAV